MRLAFNFHKGFPALEEGMHACGVELVHNVDDVAKLEQPVDGAVVDFYGYSRQPWRALRFHRRAQQRRIPVLALDRDAPWFRGVRPSRLWLLSVFEAIDIYASHSLQGAQRYGTTSYYVPNGAWTSRYNLHGVTLEELRESARYRYDVTFVGNIDVAHYAEHTKRMMFLHELQRRLAAHTIRCDLIDSTTLPVEQQVDIIQRSRINLNAVAAADNGPERSWGLPERCYGIPACGGFLISDERRHAADDFTPEREWISFRDMDDAVHKIRHFMAHFDAGRAIAEAAHKRVMAEHAYQHRAQRMIDLICDWRKQH